MKKLALFAFNGEMMCFIHVLLNALDLSAKGHEVKIVIEGSACKLVSEMSREGSMLYQPYQKAKSQGLIAGACRACSGKMEATAAVEAEGLPFLDDMSGHPGMAGFLDQGYEVITF